MAIICNGTCMIFDRKTILTMKQQKQGVESAFNTNLAGEHIFLVGHPFTLAGQRFSEVVTEPDSENHLGCNITSSVIIRGIIP